MRTGNAGKRSAWYDARPVPKNPRDPRAQLAKLFRLARGTESQESFANRLGCTQSHLSHLEKGKARPSAVMVALIREPRAFDLLEEVRALETKEEIAKVRARISEARAT